MIKLVCLFLLSLIIQTETMLIGKQDIAILKNSSEYSWFDKGYSEYKTDTISCGNVKELLQKNNCTITVVGGTWCEDTQHLLPQFVKVIDQIKWNKVDLYFVDREKKSPENYREKFSIDRIPTFIIYKDGIEIGRIVETVEISIEKKMEKILKNN